MPTAAKPALKLQPGAIDAIQNIVVPFFGLHAKTGEKRGVHVAQNGQRHCVGTEILQIAFWGDVGIDKRQINNGFIGISLICKDILMKQGFDIGFAVIDDG